MAGSDKHFADDMQIFSMKFDAHIVTAAGLQLRDLQYHYIVTRLRSSSPTKLSRKHVVNLGIRDIPGTGLDRCYNPRR